MRRIVCAAVKCGSLVYCGVRHYDLLMVDLMENALVSSDVDDIRGFVDNTGQFLTRHEAYHVALAAGQIIRKVPGDLGRLFSENLY